MPVASIHSIPATQALPQIHSFILFFSKFNYNIKQTEIKQEKMKLNRKKKELKFRICMYELKLFSFRQQNLEKTFVEKQMKIVDTYNQI